MLFNSIDFLFFLPITLIVYYLLPRRIRQLWLLAASYYFYMNWNAVYGLLLLGVTLATYLGAIGISRSADKIHYKKLFFLAPIFLTIGSLIFFKYADFLTANLNRILCRLPGSPCINLHYSIILPVGISFYVLQSVGYLIDVYRGTEKAERNFFKYALFLSFFPQLVAGPIERSGNLMHQLDQPQKLSWENWKHGVLLILWGYFMKLVIADRAAIFVDTVYGQPDSYRGMYIVVATLLFAIQIYCDFNGYTTIARGVALLFGIRLMDNFKAPYYAQSVSDFWRRWHISLTGWFRDYLYIPLGGNRKGILRKHLNRLIVFGISGLWHGASFAFIAWGLLNALFQSIGDLRQMLIRKLRTKLSLPDRPSPDFSRRLFKRLITFCLICITWIFFRTGDMSNALLILRYACDFNWTVLFTGQLYELGIPKAFFHVLLLSIAALFTADYYKYKEKDLPSLIGRQAWWFQAGILLSLTFVILLFGCYGNEYEASQFIYFQF